VDEDTGMSRAGRLRRRLLGAAFSVPALGTGIGLLLAPSVVQAVAFTCCVGTVVAVLRADTVERRVSHGLDREGASPDVIRDKFRAAGWVAVALSLLVSAALVASLKGS
jgi:hypothetical protein